MKPLIYLSGTIDNITVDEACGWRNQIKKDYPQYQYHDPTIRIYHGAHGDTKEIVEPDKREILESDIMLVYLTHYSAGTLMEIMYAYEHKKPVVLVDATNKKFLSSWIRYHAKIFLSLDDAMSYIKGITASSLTPTML